LIPKQRNACELANEDGSGLPLDVAEFPQFDRAEV
jgi:hypothetical protein